MIVWLASYPRSGNTFLRLVLARAFGYPTATIYDEELTERMRELLGVEEPAVPLREIERRPRPCFVKTHDLPAADRHPAIYLVRDGRDALASYARYIQTWESGPNSSAKVHRTTASATDIVRDLITHEASFGGWGPNVESWIARRPAPAVVRFESLIDDPIGATAAALGTLDLPVAEGHQEGVLPSFEELREQLPRNFRRGRVGDFREALTEELQTLFWSRYGPLMERLGYER